MKRFFMTLAAMLLVSIGAFAQNGATLKGDVNGDGKVDVEDVTSVVDLILSGKTYGYFYFGTTQPTVENYQTLSGVVATYTSIGDAVGATVSVDAGETLYMLCPAAWMKGKKVDLEDGAGNTYKFIEIIDAETVPGYVIYSTQAWNEATDLTLNFEITGGDEYFWYVGKDSSVLTADNKLNTSNSNLQTATQLSEILGTHDSGEDDVLYIVLPTEWYNQVDIKNMMGLIFTTYSWANIYTDTIDSISYTLLKGESSGYDGNLQIVMK